MEKKSKNRPNVVLMITDQQRYDTLPSAGREGLSTPHLDGLRSEGVFFSQAFTTCPMCSPARASLLTGMFPHAHGMVANHQARPGCDRIHFPDNIPLLGEYLKASGYRTGYVGKWHLGTGGARRGFEDFTIRLGDGAGETDRPEDNDYANYMRKLGFAIGGKKSGTDPDRPLYDERIKCGPSRFPLADHAAVFTCEKAESFIRDSAAREGPFLLVYSTTQPHPPFVCPEPFFSMYDPNKITLPETWRDESGRELLKRADWQLKSTEDFDETDLRKMWAAYLGTVSFIDHLVGRLLFALNDTGEMEDTLFIFTSDHGEMLGSHGLLFKGASFYEELIHIPLLMRPPGGTGKDFQSCPALVSHLDLFPTILSACRIEIPPLLEGIDLNPTLNGEKAEERDAVQAEFHSTNWTDPIAPLRMWRTKEWKYVEARAGDHELYDLEADPGERFNRSGQPDYIEREKKLAEALHAWCRKTGDAWPRVPLPSKEEFSLNEQFGKREKRGGGTR